MVHLHSTTLETLCDAAHAGLIDWPSVQQRQANMMPRCANHPDQPAPVVWEEQALCVNCVMALVEARKEVNHATTT